jgi:hypothetical protein
MTLVSRNIVTPFPRLDERLGFLEALREALSVISGIHTKLNEAPR